MSQISVIFGMPLMILMVTEGPNRERNSDEQELLQKLVSKLPPDSDNKAVALLLMYMGNHMETADEDFSTIPERWVMRFFFMLILHACLSRSTTANAKSQSDTVLSWDLLLSSVKT